MCLLGGKSDFEAQETHLGDSCIDAPSKFMAVRSFESASSPAKRRKVFLGDFNVEFSDRVFEPKFEDPKKYANEDWEIICKLNDRFMIYKNIFCSGILDTKDRCFFVKEIYHLIPIPSVIKIYNGDKYDVYVKKEAYMYKMERIMY